MSVVEILNDATCVVDKFLARLVHDARELGDNETNETNETNDARESGDDETNFRLRDLSTGCRAGDGEHNDRRSRVHILRIIMQSDI